MNIESLKEALGDEKFAALKDYVDDLTGQRDAARKESIDGRKGLKAKLDAATARVSELEDWAGIDAGANVADLPPPKGAADAAKQFEAKLKRAERERDDAFKARDEVAAKFRSNAQRVAIAEALNAHEFADRDIAETFISRFVEWNDDALVFKGEDGRILSLKDGVASVVKTKPALLKSQGTGGAGFQGSGAGGGGPQTMTRAEFEALPPAKRVELSKAGLSLT
jgi:hypothetical protein